MKPSGASQSPAVLFLSFPVSFTGSTQMVGSLKSVGCPRGKKSPSEGGEASEARGPGPWDLEGSPGSSGGRTPGGSPVDLLSPQRSLPFLMEQVLLFLAQWLPNSSPPTADPQLMVSRPCAFSTPLCLVPGFLWGSSHHPVLRRSLTSDWKAS